MRRRVAVENIRVLGYGPTQPGLSGWLARTNSPVVEPNLMAVSASKRSSKVKDACL
jgi:hypothetical protein